MSDNSNASPWKNPAIWSRVALVLLFLLIFALIVGPLVVILGLAQALFTIFTGEDNQNLRDLAATLTAYIHEILRFATSNREQRPFPFSDFPGTAGQDDPPGSAEEDSETVAETAPIAEQEAASEPETQAPAKKTTRKRTSSRKAAPDDSDT